MIAVMGLDLSLRNSGVAVAGADWACNWERVLTAHFGEKLSDEASCADHCERLEFIRNTVMTIAHQHKPRVTHAYILGYAYNKAQVSRAHAAGELGGVIKLALRGMGVIVDVVVESRARTLLGKAPRAGAKDWSHAQLHRARAPKAWSGDELDAFVALNFGMSELDLPCLILRDQPGLPGVLPTGSTHRARLRAGSQP